MWPTTVRRAGRQPHRTLVRPFVLGVVFCLSRANLAAAEETPAPSASPAPTFDYIMIYEPGNTVVYCGEGDVCPIRWDSRFFGTASSVLDVYLYFDGGFDQEIAHNIVRNVDYTNVGGFVDVYYWTVPSGLSCSDLYSIYITDTGGGDSSSMGQSEQFILGCPAPTSSPTTPTPTELPIPSPTSSPITPSTLPSPAPSQVPTMAPTTSTLFVTHPIDGEICVLGRVCRISWNYTGAYLGTLGSSMTIRL